MSSPPVDVLVVGAGPAGTAAAIQSALYGLRVRILERAGFPRHRPGETLHPGLEPLFEQLGVAGRVAAAADWRHEGQAVIVGEARTVTPFGADAVGPWRGYQIDRAVLDGVLLERARELGVEVRQPEAAGEPVVVGDRVAGIRSHPACYLIDGSGGRGWLRRRLGLQLTRASPPLRAYYGYCEGDMDRIPCLVGDESGWTWTARVAPGRVHWTRLSFSCRENPKQPPARVAGCGALGRVRGADVTWRLVPASAGPGYFIVGDAAAVVDPAASHGVLRALMTGIAAARAIASVAAGEIAATDAAGGYRDWLGSWFAHDVDRLTDLYRQFQRVRGSPWPRP